LYLGPISGLVLRVLIAGIALSHYAGWGAGCAVLFVTWRAWKGAKRQATAAYAAAVSGATSNSTSSATGGTSIAGAHADAGGVHLHVHTGDGSDNEHVIDLNDLPDALRGAALDALSRGVGGMQDATRHGGEPGGSDRLPVVVDVPSRRRTPTDGLDGVSFT
jgi:hypothetical protein